MKTRQLNTILDIHKQNDFIIKWRLSDMCNYNCSYCLRHATIPLCRTEGKPAVKDKEDELVETADKINDLLLRNPQKEKVKINLIGGEVSLFDLKRVLGHITARNYKNSQMTTNLSAPTDYYINLYQFLKERGVGLSVTGSFHAEHADMDTFFAKAARLNEKLEGHFRMETVSMADNQDLCHEFQKRAESAGIKYMIDIDLRLEELETRRNEKVISGGNTAQKDRYLIYLEDGTKEGYVTRTDFLRKGDTEQNLDKKSIKVAGFYCTHSYDFIYIEQGFVYGRFGKTIGTCTAKIPIDKFNLLSEPLKCYEGACTLCGNCSISKDKYILLNYKSIIDKLDREE